MKAVILAGGDGKNLRPVSAAKPTPMLKLFSKPVIGYMTELLKANSFDEITVTLGYMGKMIEDYVTNEYGEKVRLNILNEMGVAFSFFFVVC